MNAPAPLADLYAPLAAPRWVLGHLGQSLDGFVATASGHSSFVNGSGDLDHLHRLRALADVVLVGAGTVAEDDPALTVRRVPGRNPVRVVLDPRLRLPPARKLFADGAAPTLLAAAERPGLPARHGGAEIVGVPARADGRLDLRALIATLDARGLCRIFVEGGGVTVSRFLAEGMLDRLQIAVAPVLIGGGRRGIDLAPSATMADALRPPARRFALGADVLFDFDLRAAARSGAD